MPFSFAEAIIRITLRDNGVGLQASLVSAVGGQGLANMRASVASIGAVLQLNSSDAGTELQLEVPVHRHGGATLPASEMDEARAASESPT
jgi:signal transduction histidine kinase